MVEVTDFYPYEEYLIGKKESNMKKAVKSIDEIGFEICSQNMLQDNPHFIRLYHYTNSKIANEKILRGDILDFRFTKAKNFLDKNEGIAIFEPYYHACGYLFDRGEIDQTFYGIASKIKPKEVKNQKNKWVLCFSLDDNSTFMKERYAAKKCSVLKIQSYLLEAALSDSQLENPTLLGFYHFYPVCYSFSRAKQYYIRILKLLYKSYLNDIKSGKKKQDAKDEVRDILIGRLNADALFFKDANYSKEKEVRLVFEAFDAKGNRDIFISSDNQCKLYFGKDKKLHLSLIKEYFLFDVNIESSADK